MSEFEIKFSGEDEYGWRKSVLEERWGSEYSVSRGKLLRASKLFAYAANFRGSKCGLITFDIQKSDCEIVTLDSLIENIGIGTALLETVIKHVKNIGCKRVWLITTNDNYYAMGFYQKRGFRMAAVYPNAIEGSRKLKPEIPLFGIDGIPIRDEIEFEMLIQ